VKTAADVERDLAEIAGILQELEADRKFLRARFDGMLIKYRDNAEALRRLGAIRGLVRELGIA